MRRSVLVWGFVAWLSVVAGCGTDSTGHEEPGCTGASTTCDASATSDADELDAPDARDDTGGFDLDEDVGDDTDVVEADVHDADDVGWDQDGDDVVDEDLTGEDVVTDTEAPQDVMEDMTPPPPDEPEPFVIRFATYNVRTSNLNNSAWGDTHIGWDSNDAARMRKIADTIADQNLTVVAAQEIRRPEREAILTRLTNAHGENWGHSTYKQGRDDTAVLFEKSVWKFIRETHYIIPMQDGLEDRYQVGALLEHKATGRRVWFYSVHFAAGGAAGGSARRTGAQRTLNSIQNRAVANDLPFVLGGDFNSSSSDAPADILRDAGIMKYTRAVADERVGNGCKTLNSNAGSEGHQACPGGAARHIDQVWVSKGGMKVLKYQVTATAHTSRSSDHNPVTTILRKL